MWQLKNSKCDKIQQLKNFKKKIKLGQNSTQSLTNFKNSNSDKIQQLKLWQNSTTQNSKSQILIKRKISDKSLLLRTTWHLDNRWDVFEAAICDLAMFLKLVLRTHRPFFFLQNWNHIFKTVFPKQFFIVFYCKLQNV